MSARPATSIAPPSKAELAWRERCRDQVIKFGRSSGSLPDWLANPSAALADLPYIPDEDAENTVAELIARHSHGGAA